MKIIKTLFKIAGYVLAVVLVALLAHPVWLGPVVKGLANSKVPEITKTGFNLGEFSLNLYRGRLHMGDMQLRNPERFYAESKPVTDVASAIAAVGDALSSSSTNAVGFSSIDVSMSPLSVLGDTVHIGEITIKDLFVYGDATFSNIGEIIENASGGKEKDDGGKEVPEAGKKDEPAGGAEPEAKKDGGKKVVIDRVFITGTKIQWSHGVIPIPDIEILDIGKDGGGVSEDGAIRAIVDAICEAADKVSAGMGSALKMAVEGADALVGAVKNVAGTVGDVVKDGAGALAGAVKDGAGAVAGAAGDVAGATAGAVKDGAGAVAGAAGGAVDAAGDAAGAVGGAIKDTAGAVGGAIKDTAGAVGGAINSAADSVKSLF